MKKELKQGLIGLLTGTALLFNVGCHSGYQKDFFGAEIGAIEKRIAVFAPVPPLIILHGGQYNFKKVIDSENNETIGYDISYHRWTEAVGLRFGENQQRIIVPGAKNMSIKQNLFLKDRFDITYKLNGQERLDEYHLGFTGNKCKLKDRYILDNNKKIKIE